jgi:mRNA interferase MazF
MRSGDVHMVDFGWPVGSEAGFVRPAVIVTDDQILGAISTTPQVVPFTSTVRDWPLDVSSEWGEAQVHPVTTVSVGALGQQCGTVGTAKRHAIRQLLFDLFGMP